MRYNAHKKNAHKKGQGFTLIEVLIALVVVSVSVLSLMSLLFADMRSDRHAEAKTYAASTAQTLLARCAAAIPNAAESGTLNGFSYTITPTPTANAVMLRIELNHQNLTKPFQLQGVVPQ
ncbi:MAG: prepilin-type N-terminal cleavage/methylation domain-containing protein [Zetaproteobacteria bacterium]|nr:prepilin-type N-terminal cleavage/methylation domain-containing protein [Zetaproteobacteria bacterium]